MKSYIVYLMLVVLLFAMSAGAQQTTAGPGSATVVPQLIKFRGVARSPNGQPPTGTIGITFALYSDQQGGAPLWLETQNVQLDSHGNYAVQLGATLASGLPASLFASGEARWVGVQVSGQEEQPRVMLLSVPYAMKAGDAQTLGGKAASAYALAAPAATSWATSPQAGRKIATPDDLFGGGPSWGIPNFVPKFMDGFGDLWDSEIFDTGNSVGIGTTAPAAKLEVYGTAKFDGLVTFASSQTFPGTATLGPNTFIGNQTVNGNLSATGAVTGGSYQIGSNLFAFGSYANQNAFFGFAGTQQ